MPSDNKYEQFCLSVWGVLHPVRNDLHYLGCVIVYSYVLFIQAARVFVVSLLQEVVPKSGTNIYQTIIQRAVISDPHCIFQQFRFLAKFVMTSKKINNIFLVFNFQLLCSACHHSSVPQIFHTSTDGILCQSCYRFKLFQPSSSSNSRQVNH